MANYSLTELASNIEFDVEDYIPLLELFVDTTYSNLSDIRTASASFDSELITTNIHNIKGVSLNLGLNKIAGIVEQMSKLNKESYLVDIEAMVQECETELSYIRKLLE